MDPNLFCQQRCGLLGCAVCGSTTAASLTAAAATQSVCKEGWDDVGDGELHLHFRAGYFWAPSHILTAVLVEENTSVWFAYLRDSPQHYRSIFHGMKWRV